MSDMSVDNKATIRQASISCYLKEHPEVDMENPGIISKDLGIAYGTVREDIRVLKEKLKVDFSQYNLEGLRKKAHETAVRFVELMEETRGIVKDKNVSKELKLRAITVEAELLNNLYHLEHDGIGTLTDTLEQREKDELEVESNQEI